MSYLSPVPHTVVTEQKSAGEAWVMFVVTLSKTSLKKLGLGIMCCGLVV